jgi:hypothetical protein
VVGFEEVGGEEEDVVKDNATRVDDAAAATGPRPFLPLHRASFLGAIFSMRVLLSWATDDQGDWL